MSDIVCLISESTGKMIRARKGEEPLVLGDYCIVDSELGGDLAQVVDDISPICCHRQAMEQAGQILRKATEDDKKKWTWLKEKEGRAFEFCLQRIRSRNLPMKLVSVRYFFNEKKGIFYYTADGRIDFRQLVKDLAKELKMRIEMRQVGVRDEAKMLGGLGTCGRELCCFAFMKTFEPVTIQKARKQQIVINPTKISGLCGRLMCCLAFEAETKGRLYIAREDDNLIED
jgi:cell fate regulator YaaT (PSP1 superfamily)